MAGFLSSVNLIAGAGILGNVGGVPISANSAVISGIGTYSNLSVVTQFANVRSTGSGVLSGNAESGLNNLAANIFPALTNTVPTAYQGSLGSTPVGGLTSIVSDEINRIMGNGDIGIFDQLLGQVDAFRITSNQLINSVVNANDTAATSTYSSQDVTMTGGLSQISLAFRALGEDLAALGFAIDLTNLPNIGSPQALLRQIYTRTNGLPELTQALIQAGIGRSVIDSIDTVPMTDEQQKIAFEVMTKITRNPLIQILRLLKVTTREISNLADLLNPVKAFPNSFNTLTAPTSNGLRAIYINSSGAVNTNLETELPANVLYPLQGYVTVRNTYSQLKKIIPADWALANKALQAGLEQVKSIFNTNLPSLSAAVTDLESNRGLDLINALTDPLPANVVDFYETSFVSGTGLNGTVLLADIIGSAGGWVVTANVSSAANTISTLSSAGSLTTLTNSIDGVFTVMQNTINGNYSIVVGDPPELVSITIPSGLPGAGTYSTYDLAFTGPGTPGTGLLPAAYTLINNIIANNNSAVSNANAAWSNVAAQISGEYALLAQAGVEFSNLIPGLQATSLVNGLASYGLDTEVGGPAWFLESVSNVSTLGGQAIISTMREARNQVRLQTAGVQTDIVVNDVVPQPQAPLSSGQYTAAEAAGQKII